MDDIPIPAFDRERIEAMVAAYRNSIENLYRMAYMQGEIDKGAYVIAELSAKAPA